MRKLAPGGVVVMHVSNRNMELASVVAAAATDDGLVAWTRDRFERDRPDLEIDPLVVVLARRHDDLGPLRTTSDWKSLPPERAVKAWTDDYADIVSAIWRKFRP